LTACSIRKSANSAAPPRPVPATASGERFAALMEEGRRAPVISVASRLAVRACSTVGMKFSSSTTCRS
jgi:hypothetical protein